MSFVSSRIKINNLIKLDTSKNICLDNYSVFLVPQGFVSATVGKEVYTLSSGDILIADKREICFFGSKVLGFSFDTEQSLDFGIFSVFPQTLPLIDAIDKESGSAIYPLLELLLCYSGQPNKHPSDNRDALLFKGAVEILSDNVEARISVEELADALGISLSHVKRIFSNLSGVGAHDYFNLLKICKAKELLLGGESVTQTAEKTGFANQAYFSAAFKRITGVSPKDFAGKSVKRRPVTTLDKQPPKTKRDLPDYLL